MTLQHALHRRATPGLAVVAALLLASCATVTDASEEAPTTRTYESQFGPVELPADIERVVSVDFYTPAALIDVGIEPVGVVASYFAEESAGIPDTYRTAVQESDAVSIGEYYELNIEAVASARPDVIVATDDFLPLEDPMRTELEKIAPIVTFSARDSLSWKSRADAMAELMGREAELAPVKEAYETRLDEVREAHAETIAAETIAVVVANDDSWGTYAATHFTGGVWSDLGVRYREQGADEINAQGFPEWFSYEVLERLSDATVFFSQKALDENPDVLAANGIWDTLPAVQTGMVFENIRYSPTGSYGWALENVEDIDVLLDDVDAARAARDS